MDVLKVLDSIAGVLVIICVILAVLALMGAAREWYLSYQQEKKYHHENHK